MISLESYLEKLCVSIPNRHVGNKGNQEATDFFTEKIASFEFSTKEQHFDCIDWEHSKVRLKVEHQSFEAFVGPYSLSCNLTARLIEASTLNDLIVKDLSQKIVLIHGELAKEQLMPKNFPFYNPEMHKKIYQLLEEKSPAAIIAATSRNPELAGGMYPFPLIEDGDFDIPSVYMTDIEGDRLIKFTGQKINLNFQSFRLPSKACNVVARKGSDLSRRIVLCAHIDSKKGTPGALDNATGIVTLLALAEKLKEYQGEICVEIVALNGEDYYSAGGQKLYLELNSDKMDTILLAIDLDGVGYYKSKTMYSLFDLPDHMATRFKKIFSEQFGFVEGPQWYQSDHMIFVQQGRPAVAITSENYTELSTHITHTPKDKPELVDCLELKKIAVALYEFLKF